MIEFVVPFPPRELSPNGSRGNHFAHAAVAKTYRATVFGRALIAKLDGPRQEWPLEAPVTATLTFLLPDRRGRDYDNLVAMFKPGLDGLRDAGLIRDDNVWVLKLVLDVELSPRNPGVRVRLEAADGR